MTEKNFKDDKFCLIIAICNSKKLSKIITYDFLHYISDKRIHLSNSNVRGTCEYLSDSWYVKNQKFNLIV